MFGKAFCSKREGMYNHLILKVRVFYIVLKCQKIGRCMLHSLKSPPFKGFYAESFHLQKLQLCAD